MKIDSSFIKLRNHTVLSLLGLVLSLSGTVIIIRYLHQEWSVDHWMPDLNRTYMLLSQKVEGENTGEEYFTTIGEPNKEEAYVSPVEGLSAVECWTNLNLMEPIKVELSNGESFLSSAAAIDSSFSKLFPYKVVAGSLVLHTEGQAIVSEEFAKRFFPDDDAVGQTIILEEDKPHTIMGVFRQPATKSSFRFDVARYAARPWDISLALRVGILRLNKGYTAEEYNAQQPVINSKYYYNNAPYRHRITPFEGSIRDQMGEYTTFSIVSQSQPKYLWMLFTAGVLLFFVGVFNFLNLQAVMLRKRGHEMQVRRIFGASKWDIFTQLYIEGLIIASLAMLGVWMIIELATPHMQEWFSIEQINMPVFDTVLSLGIMFILPLIAATPLLSGRLVGGGHGSLFLFLQYFISLTLITVSIYMMRQLHLMMDSDPGYRTDNLLLCNIFPDIDTMRSFHSNEEWETYHNVINSRTKLIQQRLGECPYIKGMCVYPGYLHNTWLINLQGTKIGIYNMNDSIRRIFGLELLEGRMLNDSLDDWHTHYHCILNETAVRKLGIKDWRTEMVQLPRRLWIGVGVDDNYNPPYKVVGIIKDFHPGRLSEPQQAMFFTYEEPLTPTMDLSNRSTPERVVLDVLPGAEKEIINYLKRIQKETLGVDDLECLWLIDMKNDLYKEDRRTARIFFTFAFLALGVTCLGVLGLMMFEIRGRRREIALRKVHGAGLKDIALLLSRRYLYILGLAAVVSIPVSLIGLHKLITQYYTIHASIAWWIPIVSLLIVLLLSALTLWQQLWQAARTDPAEVIKGE